MQLQTYQKQFIHECAAEADKANVPFPEMEACEAALESGYGHSALAHDDGNLFGMKQHKHPVYGTHVLPTKEFLDDKWKVVDANWIHYPNLASCFADRVATLRRLASVYQHYNAALEAKDPITFVMEVSKTWSTDPNRANKVIAIFREMYGALAEQADEIRHG